MNLKTLFPHGSTAFFQANHQIGDPLQPAESKRDQAQPLGQTIPGEKESLGRVVLSFRGFFVRLKDPDNFVASLKDTIDGLSRLSLIRGDEPDKIKIIAEQEQVDHFAQERIELKITYP